MKHDPSNTQNRPLEPLDNPNEDGCVIGTAGRDEDPNATTDWAHPERPTVPADATVTPPNGTPGIDAIVQADDADAD
ncbi:hypothetical protein [Pseudomonas orientalis]|uniref:hypothetical protein n=1 Tax=Pseudomonas orientalis TaxID=76758 RepID=UPI000F56B84E|nr:hypothetical protein [Pseudomonas orientalis]AZE88764.1 hypothetical protein C4J97_2063 [Pseudomonas orientalis]AZE94139.1 hypothetical protein C4J96_2021 [Pseudomonas orientalis]AZE99583.1 hypothetical protein C4J95_2121 [Pseudomonas orientalis]